MSGHHVRSIEAACLNESSPDFAIQLRWRALRRYGYLALVGGTAVAGISTMTKIMLSGGLSLLEMSLLFLFAATFCWICVAFWNAAIGFLLVLFKLDPHSLKKQRAVDISLRIPSSRTALVMPIYNEDTERVFVGLRAVLDEILNSGHLEFFDFYVLSDTQNKDIIEAEKKAWFALHESLPDIVKSKVFYRRRHANVERKVGNLRDFCERWGSYYNYMLVLDADSIMTSDAILRLVYSMEDNPKAGLIQTVPIPVRQTTFFGRFLQFAAVLHSPMLANGLAFWQMDSANYWGHNAIVRIDAFINCCGLPKIPGRGPLSGEILSHDFVEAALLRRDGWCVYLLPNLEGSYEEVPSNLLDYATRDRRWVQGNMQHLMLLVGTRLAKVSRLHFFFGAIAYITTLLWLLMLTLSTADAIWNAIHPHSFFSSNYQLFPDWPVDNSPLIYSMLYLTAGMLLLPKLMATVCAIKTRLRDFGGISALLPGSLVEILFSILVAPLMMVYHSYFVVSVFLGFKVSWNAQARDSRVIPWQEAFKRTLAISIASLIWGTATYLVAPGFFYWLLPVLAGLLLAAPIVRYSSSNKIGSLVKRLRIFVCPYETRQIAVIRYLDHAAPLPEPSPERELSARLLPERRQIMPVQSFSDVA